MWGSQPKAWLPYHTPENKTSQIDFPHVDEGPKKSSIHNEVYEVKGLTQHERKPVGNSTSFKNMNEEAGIHKKKVNKIKKKKTKMHDQD